MEELKKSTLMQRSKVLSISLKWNSEKFKNGQYISDSETIDLFNSALQSDCKQKHKHFIMLLADPLTTLRDFYWTFDVEFFIFAFTFYQCDDLITELCRKIINMGQRKYFQILIRTQQSENLCFNSFSNTLMATWEDKQKHENELINKWIKENVKDVSTEPVTFKTIYERLPRQ